MARPTEITKRRSNRKCLINHPYASATKPQPSLSFFTIPTEIRLIIYGLIFTTGEECTLRRSKDVPPRHCSSKQTLIMFPSSILQTNKTIHTEALPIFYGSQTFHYSTELNGLFGQPTIPNAYLGWMKHMSIDVTVAKNTLGKVDSIIAIHTRAILQHCTQLSSFTLHIIKAVKTGLGHIMHPYSIGNGPHNNKYAYWTAQDSLLKGASAKLLKALRARVQQLSIVYLGKWQTLYPLRNAIADDEDWVQEDRDRCDIWPALSLTKEQNDAVTEKKFRTWTEHDVRGHTIHPNRVCVRAFHCRRAGDFPESRRVTS
ncbi:hypothetical protein BDR22DRAFT_892848 [Usnea florida]